MQGWRRGEAAGGRVGVGESFILLLLVSPLCRLQRGLNGGILSRCLQAAPRCPTQSEGLRKWCIAVLIRG